MTELSRSLLAAAREGLAPDAAVAARVRAKVAAAVGGATGASTAIPAKAGASSMLLKLGAALLAVGVLATAIVVGGSDRAPEAPRLGVVTSEPDEVRTDVRVVSPNERPAMSASPRARVAPVAPAERDAPVERDAPAEVPAEPATLSREVELIDLAMASLRKNAPGVAIEAIRVFERETLGRGQMAEEAAAIEIEARCSLGEEVTAALARFDQTWPSSAQRSRIQASCARSR